MWLLLFGLFACRTPSLDTATVVQEPEAVLPVASPVWPERGAVLHHPVIEAPRGLERQTVFINAGHGNGSRNGNLGAWCTPEADFTLEASDALAGLLEATGHFRVYRGRTGTQRPSYGARIRHLERSGASAMIELHSDVRASSSRANGTTEEGEICWRDDSEPGFTVLVDDRTGEPEAIARRLDLAREVAWAMTEAGFLPWVGDDYDGLYERDEVDGVWRDRRGLYMLRNAPVPAVIIETHNARDGRETLRWEEAHTQDAFGRAMLVALFRWVEGA